MGKFAGSSTIEFCLIIVLLSLFLVYDGTGNLNIIRMLRSRVGTSHYSVKYRSHMACKVALGFQIRRGAEEFKITTTYVILKIIFCLLLI